jgi:hypothetical protein
VCNILPSEYNNKYSIQYASDFYKIEKNSSPIVVKYKVRDEKDQAATNKNLKITVRKENGTLIGEYNSIIDNKGIASFSIPVSNISNERIKLFASMEESQSTNIGMKNIFSGEVTYIRVIGA